MSAGHRKSNKCNATISQACMREIESALTPAWRIEFDDVERAMPEVQICAVHMGHWAESPLSMRLTA